MSFFKTSFLHKSSKSFSRIACGIGAKNGTEKDLSLELRDLSQTCHEKKLETNGAAIGKLGSQVTLKSWVCICQVQTVSFRQGIIYTPEV